MPVPFLCHTSPFICLLCEDNNREERSKLLSSLKFPRYDHPNMVWHKISSSSKPHDLCMFKSWGIRSFPLLRIRHKVPPRIFIDIKCCPNTRGFVSDPSTFCGRFDWWVTHLIHQKDCEQTLQGTERLGPVSEADFKLPLGDWEFVTDSPPKRKQKPWLVR
jgi:hypothetical protein